MQDSQLTFRDGTADMTATLTGSYIQIPPSEADLSIRIVVPTLAETGDKLAVSFTYSDNGTDAKEIVTLPDITYAKVVTSKITEYFTPLLEAGRYVKVTATATDADSGTDFNAGKVLIAVVPAGRYNKKSSVLNG